MSLPKAENLARLAPVCKLDRVGHEVKMHILSPTRDTVSASEVVWDVLMRCRRSARLKPDLGHIDKVKITGKASHAHRRIIRVYILHNAHAQKPA